MENKDAIDKIPGLYSAIVNLPDEDTCFRFFQDLCTVAELRDMEQRYEVACLLNSGCSYNEILKTTGSSSATISRVSRALLHGSEGYHDLFELQEREHKDGKL